jgi:hypothetical protein
MEKVGNSPKSRNYIVHCILIYEVRNSHSDDSEDYRRKGSVFFDATYCSPVEGN